MTRSRRVKKEGNDQQTRRDSALDLIDRELEMDRQNIQFRCLPCGTFEDDNDAMLDDATLKCDICQTWQHKKCFFGREDARVPTSYSCMYVSRIQESIKI